MTGPKLYAGEGSQNFYTLSNDTMSIVTQTKEFPKDGHFNLTPKEADLVLAVEKNDYLIGEHLGEKLDKEKNSINCDHQSLPPPVLSKSFENRYRIGAISINAVNSFEKTETAKYNATSYRSFANTHGLSDPKYNWDNLMERYKNYDSSLDAGENAKKLAAFLKAETGTNVPLGALASEFMYHEMIASPSDWKNILERSKNALSFDDKISLVSKLGGQFGDDYNYSRAGVKESGVIPINVLIQNLSNGQPGGVCRDVALAQTQMLKAMGVSQSYSVNYLSNVGGHATVIVVDPNDKNRLIKMNYGEFYSEDGKKGTAALDQDNTLPNVGMQYRIFDNDGKPLASVPTQIGSILQEVTGKSSGLSETVNQYSIQKVYFGNNAINGSLFTGTTSTGEKISGVALNVDSSSKNIVLDLGMAGYNAKAEKSFYSINENGLYMNGKVGARATVIESKYGKLSVEVGGTVEVLVVKAESTSKANNGILSETAVDGKFGTYAKANHEIDLSSKDKISSSVELKGRVEKSNTADEGSRALQYDGVVIISKYDHKLSDDMVTSVAVAESLNKYGNSVAFKAALESGNNKFTVGGNLRTSNDTPSFFVDQQNAVKVGYEKRTTTDWNFKIEYGKNLDSKTYVFTATAGKRF